MPHLQIKIASFSLSLHSISENYWKQKITESGINKILFQTFGATDLVGQPSMLLLTHDT